MTLTEWKNSQFRAITWDYIARQIAASAPEGQSFYTNQLHRNRSGLRRPRQWELAALMELTGDEVESFVDPLEGQ